MKGFLNYWILKWLFIRFCTQETKVLGRVNLHEISVLRTREEHGMGFTVTDGKMVTKHGILFWPFPLSGWDNKPYKYILGRPRYWWYKTTYKKITY